MKTVLTACPFCSCGCELYLHAGNGRPDAVSPAGRSETSHGRLCARGWSAHEAVAWGRRLIAPSVGKGSAARVVGWDIALDAVARRLAAFVEEGRPVGVLGSARATTEENYLAVKLARGALGTGNIDACLRAGFARQSGALPPRGTLDGLAQAEVILLVEGDVASTHPQVASAILRAVRTGAFLVTVAARRTQLSRIAAVHLTCPPGDEAAFIRALIPACADPRHRVSGVSGAAGSNPGSDREGAIARAAERIGRAGHLAVVVAPAGEPDDPAVEASVAVAELLDATGQAALPSTVALPLPARFNLRGALEAGVAPDLMPGGLDLADRAAAARLEELWDRRPALGVGLPAAELLGGVRALVIVADDPVAALRDSVAARDALSRLEFLAVLDAFETETSRMADAVLPIASFAENEGTSVNLEGRRRTLRPCVAPPGGARPGWRALADLLSAVGLPADYRDAASVSGELAAVAGAGPAGGATSAGSPDQRSAGATSGHGQGGTEFSTVLTIEGVYDWGSDPLVRDSPTLRRDPLALLKQFPKGAVAVSREDADAVGVRQGWPMKLSSLLGEVVLPVILRDDLASGVMVVPCALREWARPLLGGAARSRVSFTRV